MTGRQLTFDRIEDYLGNPATRFFSAGYRRAEHRIGDVVVTPEDAGEPGTNAVVMVEYPRDWSKKTAAIDIAPHLSSIDTVLLGVQLSEAHLAYAYGLDEGQRAGAWLRQVNLQAGASPQEDLVDLRATAKLRRTEPTGVPGTFVSVYDCRIGAMRARCEIEHGLGDPATEPLHADSLDGILAPAEARYHGDGFKFRRHVIEDVYVDMEELTATADVEVVHLGDAPTPRQGVEGRYQPSLSMIDAFVLNLQLAQVLLYEMDGLRRDDSNTLWMQRTALRAEGPRRPCTVPLPARASVRRSDLIRLRGGSWRDIDLTAECGGVSLGCSLAHELPAMPAAAR